MKSYAALFIALLLAPVSYTPLRDAEVFQHYRAVAGASDLPLCIYNNPGTTHFNFSLELLQRLADIPTIKAVKMPLPVGKIADDLALHERVQVHTKTESRK